MHREKNSSIELPVAHPIEPTPKLKGPLLLVLVILVAAVIATFLGFWLYSDIQENKRLDEESVFLKDDLSIEFGEEVRVSDFLKELKGELVNDYIVPTESLGEQEVSFEYINIKNRKRPSKFTIRVIDSTAPIVYGNSSYVVATDYKGNLTNLMMSVDNIDDNPKREIIGHYDIKTPGNYSLEYSITDASGNQTRKPFTLRVVKSSPDSDSDNTSSYSPKISFNSVIKNHKTAKTKVGIDVSAWQGEINWPAVKKAGVEFAMIRLGYQVGFGGEYKLDKYFQANVEGAISTGLPVGVYFYSYANSIDEAKNQATWIKEQISDYNLELGVAFDWESWQDLNESSMSLYTINKVADTFLTEFTSSGYGALLYGSKVYLERIWEPTHPVWLAQYYDHPTYSGDFQIWQMSDSGHVDGISEDVDINIMYLD